MERYYNINALTKNDENRQFTNRYVFISFGKLESLETQKPKNMVILRYAWFSGLHLTIQCKDVKTNYTFYVCYCSGEIC